MSNPDIQSRNLMNSFDQKPFPAEPEGNTTTRSDGSGTTGGSGAAGTGVTRNTTVPEPPEPPGYQNHRGTRTTRTTRTTTATGGRMSPDVQLHLPLFLLLLILRQAQLTSGSGSPQTNMGLDFLVVFPENIAHYHPMDPQNRVSVTALQAGTRVQLKTPLQEQDLLMDAGETRTVSVDLELGGRDRTSGGSWTSSGSWTSDQALRVTSDQLVVVTALSRRSRSLQSALVLPVDRLGTKYFVPPTPGVPWIDASASTADVTERGPFRLVIVNGDQDNAITVDGVGATAQIQLGPGMVAQVALETGAALRTVEAQEPVSVLFGHPCAVRVNCTCGLLYSPLTPSPDRIDRIANFPIPPALVGDAEDEASVLFAGMDVSEVRAYDPGLSLVQGPGNPLLYRPGLLLPLVPETEYGGCYLVTAPPAADAETAAVVMVHRGLQDWVRVGDGPLEDAEWEDVRGTLYVSTRIAVAPDTTVLIWHKSATIVVYVLQTKGGSVFGNPAPMIGSSPDSKGCVLVPEVVQIQEAAASWRASLASCADQDLELVSLSSETVRRQICRKLPWSGPGTGPGTDVPEQVWIGMRRSAKTSEWYWVNNDTLSNAHWAAGEPGAHDDGQCAAMSLQQGGDFSWRDEDCCRAVRPVCYRKAKILVL
ncbi:uncharacterized protein LOC133440806 [Cololabis saira]|uniref:uncharacterized protein LOC133440806 n=1 Tax=Cololabis saira TaxID=129043 RepID=UPI002AD417A5|nr:uncharacterized protein LOC133440806 [Cololabis saira]